jgi:hypothetical protein
MHVFALVFSADYAATADIFTDVDNLTFYPYMEKYVRDAFYPVGICIDMYETWLPVFEDPWPPIKGIEIPLLITNDLGENYSGHLLVKLANRNEPDKTEEKVIYFEVAPFSQARVYAKLVHPSTPGYYRLSATMYLEKEKKAASYRDIEFYDE